MRFEEIPSNILHPLTVLPVAGTLLLYARGLGLLESVSWVSIWVVAAMVPTTVVAWRTVEPGLDVINRRQRNRSYLTGISALLAVLGAAYTLSAPAPVLHLGQFAVVAAAVFGAANQFSKISIHTGTLTFAAGSFVKLVPAVAFAGVLLSVPVAWSRVELDCHTRKQVLQGGALGLICGILTALL
ncbi:MAG: hypothetical protein ABEK10_01140 [Candidatus Nanosalina sp.]